MSLWEIYKAKRLGYADDLWTSLIGHQLGGYSWQSDYETTPYLYRAMPNLSHYYNREIMEEVVGGSVGWNQLFPFDSDSWELLFGLSVSVNNGRFVLSGTASQSGTSALFPSRIYNQIKLIYGHKYLLGASGTHGFADFRFVIYGDSISSVQIASPVTPKILNCAVQNVTDAEFVGNYIHGTAYSADLQTYLTDLTLALGSTIADYVYSLEQSTAGSGVAWLKEHFPKMFGQYNPYDSGSIQSVSGLVSRDTVGFNAWDEEWEVGGINESNGNNDTANDIIRSKNYIAVVPNTSYYCSYGNANKVYECFFYDADKGYLSYAITNNGLVTTPANCAFMRFRCRAAYGTTYNHDICINLSDASKNGTYEPYHRNSYPLDSTLTLRGIPKLDNGKLYYDGDTYGADGSVSRKYGIRPYQNGDESLADAVTDGTNTVYKLATPTTETAQPFTKTQLCDSGGTEEFVATGVNVWDEVSESGYISIADGTDQSGSAYARSKNYSKCLPNTSYYFRSSASQETSAILWYDADKNYISGVGAKNETVTSPSNAYYFRIYYDVSTYNHDISINYPSTDTAYHPYGCLVSVGHKSKYAEK